MTDHNQPHSAEGAPPELVVPDKGQSAIAIHLVTKAGLEAWLKDRTPSQRAQAAGQKFTGEPGSQAILADGDGWLVAAGVADAPVLGTWCLAKLAESLPSGKYRLAESAVDAGPALIGWVLGQYRFDRYLTDGGSGSEGPRVLLTRHVKAIAPALAEAGAVMLVRDLVNTPAEDMGPSEIEQAVEQLAKLHRAKVRVTKGEALEREFPMVHVVGRAAGRAHAPRMIELEWGDAAHPRVAIVGKGGCFD
jgi:leucyl aminopeptidase